MRDQIFGHHEAKSGSVGLHVRRGVEVGLRVVVSRYHLADGDHFRLRRESEEARPAYDAHQLPRYLFFGAGLMTIVTLLALWWKLPDLFPRALRVLKGLLGPRPIVSGIHNIPNDGPIVFVTATDDPPAQQAILSATDRYTKFFTPECIEAAVKMLGRGNMIGVVLNGEKGEGFLRSLAARMTIELVPVYAGREGGRVVVGFGEKVAAAIDVNELRLLIEKAKFVDD